MDTVADFVYLGSRVEGSARSLTEITHRIVIANSRMKKHLNFWKGSGSLKHKISAYRMYIISTVMHGFEGWHLNTAAITTLNGFDIRMQSLITGLDHKVVASSRPVFHLVFYLRVKRCEFLGKTLRLDPEELAHQTLIAFHRHLAAQPLWERAFEGSIFADVPDKYDIHAMLNAARDRPQWRALCKAIKPCSSVDQAGVRRVGPDRAARFAGNHGLQQEDWRVGALRDWRE
jgi:hypothetical protein